MTASNRRALAFTNLHARRSIAITLLVSAAGLTACGDSATNPVFECNTAPGQAPTGTLVCDDGNFIFTASDGWKITVSDESIRIQGPQHPDYVDMWGSIESTGAFSGLHENHNGKHVKARLGNRRSILLPSGALLTTVSEGADGPMLTVTIYEGAQSHGIDRTTMTLTHSQASSADISATRDAAEADGETATMKYKDNGGTVFTNEYTQDTSVTGVPLGKVYLQQLLSETGGPGNPTQVTDYFNDPRYGNT